MRCYSKGLNRSEKAIVNKLSRDLNTRHYYIFNNLILKTENGSIQIDYVIVSPYGIFVIETKDYSGWIFGDKNRKVWTQSLPNGEKFTFQNPLRQNYAHIKTLQKHLPFIQISSFKTIIAFTRFSEFKTKKPFEVIYIDEVSGYIKNFETRVISNGAYFMVVGKLSQLCQSTDISPEEHINNLKKNHF